MAKSALNTSSDSKGKKRHNVSFSNDTKNSSNNNNVSFDTTFDTTFDENVLQYSADEKPWDGNLFDSDDPFLTDPKALDRLYSTNGDSEQRPLVSIRVQERLSILFDEVSSSPATRVIGTVHLTPFNNNATIDTFCLTVKDRRGQVERWEEQGGVCKNISATALHKALDPSDQIFRISPKHAETLEAPVLAYSCVPQLTPMPMLVKSKINRQGTNCQVSIKVRANPKNKKPLEKMVVMMVVPPDVNGESLSCSRKGGLWDGMKRTLFWTHGRLQPGEMIEIRAQFDCIDGGDSMCTSLVRFVRFFFNNDTSKGGDNDNLDATMERDIQITASKDGRINCPCQEFTDLSKIVKVLKEKDRVENLIRWLDGETDNVALKENHILSCGKRPRCRYRFGISFAILNAIRDACRPYLEQQIVTIAEGVKSESMVPYEDAFPALGSKNESTTAFPSKSHPAASNILIPRKKSNGSVNKNTSKRRIRPQPAGTLTTVTNSVWDKPTLSSTSYGTYNENIAKLPSQNPLTPVKKSSDTQIVFSTPNGLDKRHGESSQVLQTTPSKGAKDDSKIQSTTPKTILHSNSEARIQGPEQSIKHLAKIYSALIRNMLIPSTPMELHLLIRLLAVDVSACAKHRIEEVGSSPIFFKSIFTRPEHCILFAQLALSESKHIIQNLGVPLIKALVQCPPFVTCCPEIVEDLKAVVEERLRQGQITLKSPEDITGTHAILSLPFEVERDSRHNYKTQSEMAIYRNREQSRDAFLYQLRSFMSVKGKVFQAQDMEIAQKRLQEESRKITNGLLIVNMPWFAQFLCELLLQVGLAPVEETDQELLNIAGKDKLQRLHKRFSSRSSHANRSSRKLTLSHKADAASLSPLAIAQAHFTGYQEFFFIFLHSVNNYNLGIHLRSRMVATIKDLTQNYSTNNLERRLMDLQVVARFLGFLVFSPNWHDTTIDFEKLNHDPKVVAISNGLQQLESFGLPLTAIVEESWQNGHSLLILPWVTELLKMAKWDLLSLSSNIFRQLLSNLRSIQSKLSKDNSKVERFGPSMQLISFYLESFFNKTIGLPKLTSLPKPTLTSPVDLESDSLDILAVSFSMASMFASSPYIEDISNLINGYRRSPSGKSPFKARKLRPSIVSRGISVEADLFRDSPYKILLGQSNWRSTRSLSWTENSDSDSREIQKKLADAFFHKHRDLKEICEFTTSQVMKKTTREKVHACLKEAFDGKEFERDLSEQAFEEVQLRAITMSNKALRAELETSLRDALGLLGPSELDAKIFEEAIALSVTRGMHSGQSLLYALIMNESKTFLDELQRKAKKALPVKALSFNKEDQKLEELILSIEALANYLDITRESQWEVEEVDLCIGRARDNIDAFASTLSSIPAESGLRSLFVTLFKLDNNVRAFFVWTVSLDAKDSLYVLSNFLLLAIQLSDFTSYGLRQLKSAIDEEVIIHFLNSWALEPTDIEDMASLCVKLIHSRILKLSLLKKCSPDTVEKGSRIGQLLSIIEANLM